jgi:hypothetical protein
VDLLRHGSKRPLSHHTITPFHTTLTVKAATNRSEDKPAVSTFAADSTAATTAAAKYQRHGSKRPPSHHTITPFHTTLTAKAATYGSEDKPAVSTFAAGSTAATTAAAKYRRHGSQRPVITRPHQTRSKIPTFDALDDTTDVTHLPVITPRYPSMCEPGLVITVTNQPISTHHTIPATLAYRLLCVVEPGEPLIER